MEVLKLTNELFSKEFRKFVNDKVNFIYDAYNKSAYRIYRDTVKKDLPATEKLNRQMDHLDRKFKTQFDYDDLRSLGSKQMMEVQRVIHTSFALLWVSEVTLSVLNTKIYELNSISENQINNEDELKQICNNMKIFILVALKMLEKSDIMYDDWVTSTSNHNIFNRDFHGNFINPTIIS